MKTTVEGIVLRRKNYGENDRHVLILTKEMGVVSAYAKGARRIKSKFVNTTEALSYASFTLFSGSKGYLLDEASSINIFFGIRSDIIKLSLASYLAELFLETSPKDEPAEEQLQLFLNALHLLDEDKKTPNFIKSVVELRMGSLAGYMLNVTACKNCGQVESDSWYISPRSGVIYCSSCPRPSTVIHISVGAIAAIKYIIEADPSKVFSFKLKEAAMKELEQISEIYIKEQIPWQFKTLEFYNRIKSFD